MLNFPWRAYIELGDPWYVTRRMLIKDIEGDERLFRSVHHWIHHCLRRKIGDLCAGNLLEKLVFVSRAWSLTDTPMFLTGNDANLALRNTNIEVATNCHLWMVNY